MNIKRLVIENFKSIERIELIEPNPFTVFVGPNGSGKSNIFEALEFVVLCKDIAETVLLRMFGGERSIVRRQNKSSKPKIICDLGVVELYNSGAIPKTTNAHLSQDYTQFKNFCRLFINNADVEKIKFSDDTRISSSASNLEPVLKRVLSNDTLRSEIFEWLELFVPGFKAVEVDDRDELHWFEQYSSEYFTKDLISDGTYNILAMLTAVYQSNDKPQFLCIEEPENGLHPQVLMTLVDFFRKQCEQKGHYIWLNTHSESLVRGLTSDEIILVNKQNGATQTKQIKGRNLYDLPTDEAWLTGALGGGLPW